MPSVPQLILDIGTHKVLGLAVRPTEDGVEVLAAALRTHGSRAMRDGQVHDVPAVARTVRAVVDELEQRLATERLATEIPFTAAYIAAAGRALQTATGRAEQSESRPVLITGDMQRALEWDAVADAQANLLATLPRTDHGKGFYCIAHTRTDSRIDGESIASLVDQRGESFSVDVLATFLPGIVVDSLQAVLRNADLEMRGLTLEPVAALEAIVPETMRHLRLMLVDVGAGTTDIAFTGDGTVQAYAMVPLGGDSVTEALAHRFLLDFTDAERAKQRAAKGENAPVPNVLGEEVIIDEESLLQAIEPATIRLAESVGRIAESWELDGLPDAVLLVGGGSNTPRLATSLATELNMPANRIAVRDRSAIRSVAGEDRLQGPEVVTALGIALRFAREQDAPPVRVRVNGRPVSLFQPERCTVREAARIAGLPLTHLVGRFGQGMTVTINGKLLLIPGRRGESASVHVNDTPASLDTLLDMNDDVQLRLPSEGDAAQLTVRQLIAQWQRRRKEETGRDIPSVIWNGTRRPLPLRVQRRDEFVEPHDIVFDRDEFEFRWPRTVGELLEFHAPADAEAGAGIGAGARVGDDPEPSTAGPETNLGSGSAPATGTEADMTATPFTPQSFNSPRIQPFPIVLNGTPTSIELSADVRVNGNPVGLSARINDGDRIDITPKTSVALYELLSHPEIDVLRQPGAGSRKLQLNVRGESAGFTTLVHAGDEVHIGYE